MSQINDALKRAQNASPGGLPSSVPPPQLVTGASPSAAAGLIPSVVIILIIAAVFFIGWAMTHQPVQRVAAAPVRAPAAVAPPQPVAAETAPVSKTETLPPPPVIPVLPKLQGIFYSSAAPSAIVDGKTVRPGDPFKQYRVKEITELAVTLMDPEGKTTKLVMGN